MRNEIAETYSYKFDRPFTAWLYNLSMNGGCDEEWGSSTDGPCWVGMLGRHALVEDTDGAVYSFHWEDRQGSTIHHAEDFYTWLRKWIGAKTFDAWGAEDDQ